MREKAYSVQRTAYSILIFLSTIHYPLSTSYAEPISSKELIEHAKEYDGKTVEFEGEVIGDIMQRRDGAWLNVNDGDNALGIWSDKALIAKVKYTGDYNTKGDYVRAVGTFHRACREHGGDLDIHLNSLALVIEGEHIKHKINFAELNVAIALCIAASILAAAYIIRKAFSKGR